MMLVLNKGDIVNLKDGRIVEIQKKSIFRDNHYKVWILSGINEGGEDIINEDEIKNIKE